MASHNLCDASVSRSQIQESLSPPFLVDLEQLSELLNGKDKHRATTQKSEAEKWVRIRYKNNEEIEQLVSEELFTH